MDKESVVCIYTMECFSAAKKKEMLLFATIWIDLRALILNEVRQIKTNTT